MGVATVGASPAAIGGMGAAAMAAAGAAGPGTGRASRRPDAPPSPSTPGAISLAQAASKGATLGPLVGMREEDERELRQLQVRRDRGLLMISASFT